MGMHPPTASQLALKYHHQQMFARKHPSPFYFTLWSVEPAHTREDLCNTKRPTIVSFLDPTKPLPSFDQANPHRRYSKEMTGRTQTLPWWLEGVWVKTTENKIHWPRCRPHTCEKHDYRHSFKSINKVQEIEIACSE